MLKRKKPCTTSALPDYRWIRSIIIVQNYNQAGLVFVKSVPDGVAADFTVNNDNYHYILLYLCSWINCRRVTIKFSLPTQYTTRVDFFLTKITFSQGSSVCVCFVFTHFCSSLDFDCVMPTNNLIRRHFLFATTHNQIKMSLYKWNSTVHLETNKFSEAVSE